MTEVIALSGGKDSTAMALRLEECEPREDRVYFCTPTGDELPDMVAHWAEIERLTGRPIQKLRAKRDLSGLIREYAALPNFRMRWCTRVLKIEVCQAFLLSLESPVVCVGLRADEPHRAGAIYTGATERYPLREWGWSLDDVTRYLQRRGVRIPRRTDCARCYHQRIGEWFNLWRDHPDKWAEAEADEELTGHTFRTPGRDTWPVDLKTLAAEFAKGKVPRGADVQLSMFEDGPCRVCSL